MCYEGSTSLGKLVALHHIHFTCIDGPEESENKLSLFLSAYKTIMGKQKTRSKNKIIAKKLTLTNLCEMLVMVPMNWSKKMEPTHSCHLLLYLKTSLEVLRKATGQNVATRSESVRSAFSSTQKKTNNVVKYEKSEICVFGSEYAVPLYSFTGPLLTFIAVNAKARGF